MWRTNPSSSLRWRTWDDEWVVYDTGSGQTHLLDSFSAAVLGLIDSMSAPESELLATVSEHLSAAERASAPEALALVLRRLQDIGLAETDPS